MDERITDLSSLQYNLNMFNSRARMLAYKGATGSHSQSIYELTASTQA